MQAIRLGSVFRALLLLTLFSSAVFSQWVTQNSGSEYPLTAVYFLDNNTGFVGSRSDQLSVFIGGEIIRTSNGGVSWQRVLIDTNLRVGSFYFLDNQTGFAVGGSYSTVGRIFKTTDAGMTWSNVTPPNLFCFIWNIKYLNPQTGYAGGPYGVYKTTDGGASMNKVFDFAPSATSFNRMSFIDLNTGYFLADSGRVFKTINGGSNWEQIRSGGDSNYYDINFLDVNTGFISGENGRLYKTVNGGTSWNKISNLPLVNLLGIQFKNPNTGFITGFQNVLKTTNNGQNWTVVLTTSEFRRFWSVYFSDLNTGYISSDTGRVYKTTTGGVIGINPVSTEVPEKYSLSQNYPNPFNPTTNIKFSLPKAAFVRLAVYDMLGREVESLVSQQLNPGTYRVDWNAAKFSSGIYMYKLTTDDFSLVKKMSLIK